jgi:hypothetical protein
MVCVMVGIWNPWVVSRYGLCNGRHLESLGGKSIWRVLAVSRYGLCNGRYL